MYFHKIDKQLKGEFYFIARYPRNEFHIGDTSSKVEDVFLIFCHTSTQLSTEQMKKRLKFQGGSVFSDIR